LCVGHVIPLAGKAADISARNYFSRKKHGPSVTQRAIPEYQYRPISKIGCSIPIGYGLTIGRIIPWPYNLHEYTGLILVLE
jgi:hypothetical protein